MSNAAIFEDTFNLLCGALIGEGTHRKVYECKLRPDLVVKVEYEEDHRNFANVHEMRFWDDSSYHKPVKKWLAPCEFLSPDGRILLQSRCEPLREDELPERLPRFLTDIKRDNFGMYKGRVVCIDYAFHITSVSTKLKKADW